MLSALKNKMDQLAEKAQSMADAAAAEFDKLKLSESDRNDRFDTCKSCEHLYEPTSTCKKCGCFMAVKTYLPSAQCPMGKWKMIPIVQTSTI